MRSALNLFALVFVVSAGIALATPHRHRRC